MKKAALFAAFVMAPSVVQASNWQCSALESYLLVPNYSYEDPIYIQKVTPFAPDVQFEWSGDVLKIRNGRNAYTYKLHTSLKQSNHFIASDDPLAYISFKDGSLVWSTGTVMTGYYCVHIY